MPLRLLPLTALCLMLSACPGTEEPQCDDDAQCSGANPVCLEGSCVACRPGATVSCYDGPAGTAGVGACVQGTRTCLEDGSGYGACAGREVAATENCNDTVDDDCSGAPNDAPECACTPGESQSCYSGAAGTAGVGICTGGTQTCNAEGTGYGACEGEVLPRAENCNDAVDDDCSGEANDLPECVCQPGETRSCYSGPVLTRGEGICVSGTQTCNAAGTGYGACEGEVLPLPSEICGNSLDDDCNGATDDSLDLDGDGYTACDGDCCDSTADGCASPMAVNPGAYDFSGDGLDDDCNGTPDDAVVACDNGLSSGSTNPADYALAMELCQTTTLSPGTAAQRTWGLISATRTLASGSAQPSVNASSLRGSYGAVAPQAGSSLAVLSTGHAAATGQLDPAHAGTNTNFGLSSAAPADWLAANGDTFPSPLGCPPSSSSTTFDPVMLTFQVRVPTNARSFRVRAFFLSAEYPEWVCSPFNDFFVALLDSAHPSTPADKNLAVYTASPTARYPLGVNLAHGNTGLFTACVGGNTGCASGAIPGTINTCISAAPLAGTGYDVAAAGQCDAGSQVGGGTGWLVLRGNVVPGEVMTLRLALWDTGDGTLDSTVLLDRWEWDPDEVTPGTGN